MSLVDRCTISAQNYGTLNCNVLTESTLEISLTNKNLVKIPTLWRTYLLSLDFCTGIAAKLQNFFVIFHDKFLEFDYFKNVILNVISKLLFKTKIII